MKVAVVDESFPKGVCITFAIVCSAHGAASLEKALRQKLQAYRSAYGIPIREFHGAEIANRSGDWQFIESEQQGFEIIDDLVCTITPFVEFSCASVVNKKLLSIKYSKPHKIRTVGIRHLVQELQSYAAKTSSYFMLVVDNHNESREEVSNFVRYKANGTPGSYRQTKLPNMLDLPSFQLSHESFLVQACDVMAFVYQRNFLVSRKGSDKVHDVAELWSNFAANTNFTKPRPFP